MFFLSYDDSNTHTMNMLQSMNYSDGRFLNSILSYSGLVWKRTQFIERKKTEGENERRNFSFTHEIFKVYDREQCSNKRFIATVRSVSHFIFKNSNEKTYTVTQNICYFAAYSLQIRECTQLTILDSSIQKVALTCSVRQYKIHHLIKKDIIKDTYLTYIDTLLDTNLPVFTTPKDNNIIKIIQIVQLCHLLNVLQVQNNNRQVNFPEKNLILS